MDAFVLVSGVFSAAHLELSKTSGPYVWIGSMDVLYVEPHLSRLDTDWLPFRVPR